ncbi:unnamed protein product [Vicia faba]|uniref:Uncharacterized protein n=1 Tax=Vicia faba TaxID=3906 RepID=A0AAV0ZL86_VICFA|nr:unnamed protein product [Vicia faba]
MLPSENSRITALYSKAKLNARIRNLVSRIKVHWHPGRNNFVELNIKDAIQAALQTSIMDVLLSNLLTFGFRLVKDGLESNNPDPVKELDLLEFPTHLMHIISPKQN